MVNAQEWLDQNYPDKESTVSINAKNKDLEGQLFIQNFPNLKKIECGNNKNLKKVEITNLPNLDYFHANNCQLINIRISNCPAISYLNVANNLLTDNRFLDYLNPKNLEILSIHTNNFARQELGFLSKFSNLKNLFLDNNDQIKFEKGIYNRFYGSLEPLQNLTNLEILSIGNTDIDSGLQYLPKSLRKIGVIAAWKADTDSSKICQELEKASRVMGVTEKLRQHEEGDPVWFDGYYRIAPWRQAKEKWGENFENLQEIKNSEDETSGDETKETYDAQKWLNNNYPKDLRKDTPYLKINKRGLTGKLVLSDFENLEGLDCSDNKLTELDLSNCGKLIRLNCSNNQLKDIIGIKNCGKFVFINKDENDFSSATLKEIELVISEGKWKKKEVDEWLNKEYPNDGECIGIFDLENKGKKREEIEELDISSEELEGELKLDGFKKLKYLNCRYNKLTKINFSDCPNLEVIDCRGNEIKSLYFAEGGSGEKLSFLKEFHGSANQLDNNALEKLLENIGIENLTYFDIGDNGISGQISSFNSFHRLEVLYVRGNKFSGTWEDFENLKGLLEIDIRENNITIEECFKGKSLPKLEKIYHDTIDEKILMGELENTQLWKKHYDKEGGYYDFKSLQNQSLSEVSKVETILKTPILSEEKDNKVSRISENYETKKIDYYYNGKVIYPSKNEKWFEWEVGEPLPLSKLPLRLVYVNDENGKQQIEIKRRIECAKEVKNYAILSYSWGGKHREDVKWSIKDAKERLSLGGKKSLEKAIKTLEILNCFHLREGKEKVKYLWMDQLCVNQNNDREKGHEIPRMRDYYGNAAVTLVAIHAEVREENIRRLLKSFEKGESELIYPNEIIKNSLPILKKIMGSEWFSRSWTFQEGFLSKQTIFMFDDFLIDGRFMALVWKLQQFSKAHYEECRDLENLCREKVATPVGWAYYKDGEEKGYSYRDKASLRLNEALWAIKDRGRALPLDGIYSIIGLLPYGDKVKVDYGKEPESVLREVMITAVKNGYGEPLSWYGSGSKKPGLCWVPEIDKSGSSSVMGTIKTDYLKKDKVFMSSDNSDEGFSIMASEYKIIEKGSGIYKLGKEETVDGGLWMRKVLVDVGNDWKERVTLSGTRKGIESVGKGRTLVIPNIKEWRSSTPFAVLALAVSGEGEDKKNIRHRIDLVRIEEGYDRLKIEEKEFIIGLDDQQYLAQVEQVEIK